MYSDIELDANKLELELKASLDYMQELIIALLGLDVKEFATFTFKRNMMVNDESLVRMIKDSEGTISTETKVEKNPLVDDPVEELKRLKRENEQYEEDNDDYRVISKYSEDDEYTNESKMDQVNVVLGSDFKFYFYDEDGEVIKGVKFQK